MPPPKRVKKVMTLPINVIFSHLQYVHGVGVSVPWICIVLLGLYIRFHRVANSNNLCGISLFWSCQSLNGFRIRTLPIRHFFLTQFFSPAHRKKTRVRVWLYEDTKLQLEGQIIGFDEYMNMVLDDAVEVNAKQGSQRTEVGRILLKGDSITLLQEAQPVRPQPTEE